MSEAFRARHRSPGGVRSAEASFRSRWPGRSKGSAADPTYTPSMIPRATWRPSARSTRGAAVVAALVAVVLATTTFVAAPARATPGAVRVLMGEPATLDPAAAGDAGSAAFIAQLFEGLTAIDADADAPPRPRRALGASRRWPDGRLHPAARPPVLRRHGAYRRRRAPQLAACHRPTERHLRLRRCSTTSRAPATTRPAPPAPTRSGSSPPGPRWRST